MWYFPLLKPYHDHVPVAVDLSDLAEKIQWCKDNDEKCRVIAANAATFYETYVAKDGLLDYVSYACNEVARRYVTPPSWFAPPPAAEQPPSLPRPSADYCYTARGGRGGDDSRHCLRCEVLVAEKEKEERIKKEAKKIAVASAGGLRARMLKKSGSKK
jgi:hypothetical protein